MSTHLAALGECGWYERILSRVLGTDIESVHTWINAEGNEKHLSFVIRHTHITLKLPMIGLASGNHIHELLLDQHPELLI